MNLLSKVKSAIPLQDIVSDYTSLKNSGKHLYGICPLHNENTASFFVFPENNRFKCFGCGASGDTIDFISKVKNISLKEAYKLLAKKANIELPKEQSVKEKEQTIKILDFAAMYYQQCLQDNEEALQYLEKRNVSRKQIEELRLGYDDGNFNPSKVGIPKDNKALNSLKAFKNRITFPIINTENEIVAFGARTITETHPKYINSPNSEVYQKGTHPFIHKDFIYSVQKMGEVIITEGYLDAIAAWKYGHYNTIAICGTAISQQAVNYLKKLTTTITLALDSDIAGLEATNKFIPILIKRDFYIQIAKIQHKDLEEELHQTHKIEKAPIADFLLYYNAYKNSIQSVNNNNTAKQLMHIVNIIPNKDYKLEVAAQIANHLDLPISIFIDKSTIK